MVNKKWVRRIGFSSAAALTLLLAGCGNKASDSSQVLARVNGTEITIHQLNNELRDSGDGKSLDKKTVLTSLVDRSLLVDAAKSAKLDQTPGVVQEIARAQEQILARAYLQSRVQNTAPPSEADVRAFYNGNPDLFAARKTYTLDEVIVGRAEFPANAEEQMKDVKTLDQAAAWLDGKGIKYQRRTLIRSAADLTPAVNSALKKNDSDLSQLVVVVENEAVAIIHTAKVQLTPVSEADAAPQIARYLANRASAQKVQGEVQQLRGKAKIEYMNEKLIGGAPNAAVVPAAESNPQPTSDASAATTNNATKHIDRGAAGLR